MVRLQTYIPSKLASWIKCFWYLEVPADAQGLYQETIIPDGHHEMILQLHPGQAMRSEVASEWSEEPQQFFAGQTVRPYKLALKSGARLYGIRFFPFAAWPFLNCSAGEVSDRMIPLENLRYSRDLVNCLSPDPFSTFQRLEAALIRVYSNADLSSNKLNYIDYAVKKIISEKGVLQTKTLVRQTGISQRYLDVLFREYVGITPKVFSNIIQVNHFIHYQSRFVNQSFTSGSYEAGFYDQSHLNRTFKALIQKSPREFFRQANWINISFAGL